MNITKEQAALARAVLKDFADEQRRKARVAFGNYKTSASTADKSAFMQANEAADNAEYVAKRMQASPPKQSTPQPAEGDGAVLPAGYKVQRHIFGKWMYVVGDHGSANYWDTRDEAVQKAWSHHERQLTRLAATAVVPEGWKLVPIVATPSMDAAGKEALSDNGVADVHDADALVCFAAMLAAAPAAPKGGVVDWTDDAEGWGNALNEAAWAFTEACPEKSALLFNTAKPALRAAILRYAAALAQQEPRHYGLADGEATSA